MIGAAVAAALALAAAEPAAAPVRDRDIDAAEAWRVYQLPAAETLAAEGYSGLRAFFTDAWGRHRPSVGVLRKGDAPPRVFAWTKSQPVGVRAMSGEITRWDWRSTRLLMDEVRAAPIAQPPAGPGWPDPAPPRGIAKAGPGDDEEEGEAFYICTDSWTVAVEVIEDGKVTRRERKSCGDDITFDGAESLLSLAADSIEGCNAVELQAPSWARTRLSGCSVLVGEEPWSDADLLNALNRAPFNEPGQYAGIAKVLDPEARLVLADGSVRRGAAVADWYAAEMARFSEPGLEIDAVAVKGDAGTAKGGLFYLDGFDAFFWAPSEQTWRRDGDGPWRLVAWKVGPWRRETFTD